MRDTLEFFNIAKPNPTKRDFFTQYSVHVEEFAESIEAIDGKGSVLHDALTRTVEQLRWDAVNESSEYIETVYDDIDKVALLDALCDQYVTLIGTARALGVDIEGAIKEVEASNLSKFYYIGVGDISDLEWMELDSLSKRIEAEGRYKGVYWQRVGLYAVFYDESGKILKCPSTYFEPQLEKFV